MATQRRRSNVAPTARRQERQAETTPVPSLPVQCYAIDDVALATLRQPREELPTCSSCDESLFGRPATSGLLMWSRGDEVRFDEPLLCGACATTIGITAMTRWRLEEEGM
jgi:hypothetical protein